MRISSWPGGLPRRPEMHVPIRFRISRAGVVWVKGRPTRWFVERLEDWWALYLFDIEDPQIAVLYQAWPRRRDLRAYLATLSDAEMMQ